MTHKDTELDTQELREQLESLLSTELTMFAGHRDVVIDKLVPLIAQREQAAELRGRIDEVQQMQKSGFVSEFYARPRLMALQATKPESKEWWCVECKVFTNPSTHEHVIQLGDFQATKPEKECGLGCKGAAPGHTHPDQVMTEKGE